MEVPRDGEVLESPCAWVWLDDDGIVNILNKGETAISIEQHEQTYANLRLVAGGEPHPLLVDLRPIRSMDKASRDYSASAEQADVTLAVALIVSSPLSRIIGNFFIGLNKPPFPVKVFSDVEQGREWLKQQR